MVPFGGALVASTAVVEAEVVLGDRVSVWWHAVLRGDDAPIAVGEETNIQDLVMVHPDRALIGIGAILLAGTAVGAEGTTVAPGVVMAGVPARVLRDVRPEEREQAPGRAARYWHEARRR